MKETIVKLNNTKSWFFEKINKIDKPLVRLINKKREKNRINKIRNENGEVTTDKAEIPRIIREYYEPLYGIKMDNLEELDRFLEKFNHWRMNQKETAIINEHLSIKYEHWNWSCVQKSPKIKSQGPDSFTGEFYQTFTEELMPIFLKLFQKNCRGSNISKLIL